MFPPQGRGIYLGRGVITRPGYVYSRADYNPVIGYFQPQFTPTARTRFVSPTPPRTRAYYHGYGKLHVLVCTFKLLDLEQSSLLSLVGWLEV